jgi:hypothetical protein
MEPIIGYLLSVVRGDPLDRTIIKAQKIVGELSRNKALYACVLYKMLLPRDDSLIDKIKELGHVEGYAEGLAVGLAKGQRLGFGIGRAKGQKDEQLRMNKNLVEEYVKGQKAGIIKGIEHERARVIRMLRKLGISRNKIAAVFGVDIKE